MKMQSKEILITKDLEIQKIQSTEILITLNNPDCPRCKNTDHRKKEKDILNKAHCKHLPII